MVDGSDKTFPLVLQLVLEWLYALVFRATVPCTVVDFVSPRCVLWKVQSGFSRLLSVAPPGDRFAGYVMPLPAAARALPPLTINPRGLRFVTSSFRLLT